jgi:hypothetical protein
VSATDGPISNPNPGAHVGATVGPIANPDAHVSATDGPIANPNPGAHVGAPSKLDAAILRTQAKAALTGLGWNPPSHTLRSPPLRLHRGQT